MAQKQKGVKAKGFIKEKAISAFRDYKPKDCFTAAVLFFIVGVIPLVLRYKEVPVGPEELSFVRNETQAVDFFSYYRSLFIVIASTALLAFQALYYFSYPRRFDRAAVFRKPVAIPALVYIAAAVLSAVFSKFPYLAVNGITERYENIFVLLSYMVIFFTVADFANSLFQYRVVLGCLLFSAGVISVIGVMQFSGFDIFDTKTLIESGTPFKLRLAELMHKILLGKAAVLIQSLAGKFDTVYSTLYNPNPAGLYTALMFPVALFSGLFYKGDSKANITAKIVILVISGLLLVSLIGTTSVGGFAALVAEAAVTAVTAAVYLIRNRNALTKKFLIAGAGGAAVLVCSVLLVAPLRNGFVTVIQRVLNVNRTDNGAFYKDISIEGDTARVTVASGVIDLTLDHANQALSVSKDGVTAEALGQATDENGVTTYNYDVPGFGAFNIAVEKDVAMFQMNGTGYMFYLASEPGALMMVSKTLTVVDITQEVPSIGFEGRELFGSNRGYIWSRSLPLIPDTLLLGAGPDAYTMVFPQNDIAGKTRNYGDPYMVVDKPHNYYLQTAINTGMISLLALLVIFGFYLIKTFASVISGGDADRFAFGLRLGVMVGVCGYLTAAVGTDSVVSVAPVFWAVLGLGVAMLRGNKTENKPRSEK